MAGELVIFCKDVDAILEVEHGYLAREDQQAGETKSILVTYSVPERNGVVPPVQMVTIEGVHFADLQTLAQKEAIHPAQRLLYAYFAKRLNDNNDSPHIRFKKLQLAAAVLNYLLHSQRKNNPLAAQQSMLESCRDEAAQEGELKKCLQTIDLILGREFLESAGNESPVADAGLLRNKRLRLFSLDDSEYAYLVFDRGDERFSQLQILSLKKEWFAEATPNSPDPVKNLLMAYVYDVLKNPEHAELGFFGNYEKRMKDLRCVVDWLGIIESDKTLTVGLFGFRGKIAKLVESLHAQESSAEPAAH